MKFSLWTMNGARNSAPVFEAFGTSIKNAGHDVVENSHDCDVDVIWSVLWKGRMALNQPIFHNKKPTIVLEVGSIQRGVTWKVGLDGIGRHCLHTPQGNSSARAKSFGLELTLWQDNGEHILICCQNPKSLMWQGQATPGEWLDSTVTAIRTQSNRPIVVRPHPRAPLRTVIGANKNVTYQTPNKIEGTYDDYDLAFKNTHAVISWSSNPGPQAIIHGIPAFVGPDSLAYDVANKNLSNIENPFKPERQQWLNDYAHTEYTVDEIRQGIPLHNLLKTLDI